MTLSDNLPNPQRFLVWNLSTEIGRCLYKSYNTWPAKSSKKHTGNLIQLPPKISSPDWSLYIGVSSSRLSFALLYFRNNLFSRRSFMFCSGRGCSFWQLTLQELFPASCLISRHFVACRLQEIVMWQKYIRLAQITLRIRPPSKRVLNLE
jgi:hypothetical protein